MKKMGFESFVTWAFLASLTGAVTWSATFLQEISHSMQELNTKVAVVIERQEFFEKEVVELRERVKALEKAYAPE